MIVFTDKKERDALIEEIKENGLEIYLRNNIKDETAKEILSLVFETAFDRLSEEDYEQFLLDVCDNIEYEGDE